ncbi:hypothetical protein OPV22_034412 [Ensete ventricosum]|uniref:Uncharacterized protein n=1 Tax=Ensete ventricosum TaxID=4639 RepID=A0A426YV44_ENSVE|nr:hypothetical protein OPV22_034412 [Ensete ventricosum]RRT55584.1 hypothetical protein B296_00014485 [Ensete ventricosum]RWW63378.1 hypothetical protein BHE74_00029445 [Ensete ventricosum]RZR89356.1 hypothetical protein BHM03_00017058 [Ensete ventricosum]
MAKDAADSKPLGVCEKLFNALCFNAAFRPLRRLTFHEQPATADRSSDFGMNGHKTDHSPATATKPKPAKLPEPDAIALPPSAKPVRAATAKEQLQKVDPPPPTTDKPIPLPAPPPTVTTYKSGSTTVPRAPEKAVPMPAPPAAVAKPQPAPPAAAATRTKTINNKAADYIQSARRRIRSGSFTKTPTVE